MKVLKTIVFGIVLFSTLSCFSQNTQPRLEKDNLIFPLVNKIVPLDKVIQDKAILKDPGPTEYSLIALGEDNIVLVQTIKFSNSLHYSFYFFSVEGELINQREGINGEFKIFVLEKTKRLIIGDTSTLTQSNVSYVFSFQGKLVAELLHDSISIDIGFEETQNYLWFISHRLRKAKSGEELLYPSIPYIPFSHIIIFNVVNGKNVFEVDSENLTDLLVDLSGFSFHIPLPTADIPG
jgi:hypothetical protein